jgi:putative tricarboxylic transport membrane protein
MTTAAGLSSRREAFARAAGSVAGLAIGAWAAREGWRIGLFDLGSPGPGLFPFLFGVLLAAVALLSLVIDLSRMRPAAVLPLPDTTAEQDASGGGVWRSFAYVLIGAGCMLAMQRVGFLAAVFVALLVLVRGVERMSWRASLLTAFGAAVSADLLFVRLLSVQLPSWPR